jgi:hypothetical protein
MDPHFSEPVRIVCSDGNHDRNPARGMKRRRAKRKGMRIANLPVRPQWWRGFDVRASGNFAPVAAAVIGPFGALLQCHCPAAPPGHRPCAALAASTWSTKAPAELVIADQSLKRALI